MRCPRCHHNNSRVIDSRQADDGRAIRRRRECENCSYRFTNDLKELKRRHYL